MLDKHGINLAQYLGDYALEFAAVIGSITIVAELRAAVTAELAARAPVDIQATPAAPA